jgi:hypothetical protein
MPGSIGNCDAEIFYFLALERGYSRMDIIIGSIWTFVLAMIISSPIIIPVIRKRLKRAES